MDVEGVYRKSGGTSQVNQVRSGFEADNDHDISDPDLDIHAVTSAMKNYFRRLPVPLITFSVYDQFLEAGRKLPNCICNCNDLINLQSSKIQGHKPGHCMLLSTKFPKPTVILCNSWYSIYHVLFNTPTTIW
jgi:hypothetical protein